MLKSICNKCGALLDYGSVCPCRAKYQKERHREYDRRYRNRDAAAIYHNREWQLARKRAKARDNGLCLLCLREKFITPFDLVHHIEEVSEKPDRAYELDNLICLCNSCHAKVHIEHERNKVEMQEKLRKLLIYNGL